MNQIDEFDRQPDQCQWSEDERVVFVTRRNGQDLDPPEKIDISHLKPESFGCRPGIMTWKYMDAIWGAVFGERQDEQR